MTTNDEKYLKIPIWLASILAAAILAFAVDTWRTVNKLDMQLKCLRTELAAKGLIGPSITADTANLPLLGSTNINRKNQPNQNPQE